MTIISTHTSWRRAVATAAAMALAASLMAGCSKGELNGPEASATAEVPTDAPCVVENYPCNLNDVDPDIFEHTLELGDEAARLVAESEGDTAEAIELLRADDDLVDLTESSDSVTFRLTDGRPHDVMTQPSAVVGDPDEPGPQVERPDLGEPEGGGTEEGPDFQSIKATSEVSHFAPAGYQPAGEPGQDNDSLPKRKAIVIEPLGSMSTLTSGKDLVGMLERKGDVDDVTYVSGRSPTFGGPQLFDVMVRLDEYDIIHISSHGSETSVIGAELTDEWKGPADEDGVSRLFVDQPDGLGSASDCLWDGWVPEMVNQKVGRKGPDCKRYLAFPEGFFKMHYPDGLSNVVFYGDWCRSAMQPSLRNAIVDASSTYVGWSHTLHATTAAYSAEWYWAYMALGLDTSTAMDKLAAEGHTVDTLMSEGAVLQYFGRDLRIRDAVTSFEGDGGQRIAAAAELDWTGEIEDGEHDFLPQLQFEVVGVPTGDEDQVEISVFLDGKEFPETFDLSEAELQPHGFAEWGTWTLTVDEVELPFDVTTELLNEPMDWEVRVTDHTDGYSAHVVEGVRLVGPEVQATHPEGLTPLAKQGDVVHVTGTEDDGEPDEVSVVVTVTDLRAEQVDNYRVEVRLSGGTLADPRESTWPLSDFDPLGDSGTHRKSTTELLDHDLTDDNREFTIELRLVDNDGNEVSERNVTVELRGERPAACSFEVTWNGAWTQVELGMPQGDKDQGPMSGGPLTQEEVEKDTGRTSGHDAQAGELPLLLLTTDDDGGEGLRIWMDAEHDDYAGSLPVTASPYFWELDFGPDIYEQKTGHFDVPWVAGPNDTRSVGMEMGIDDPEGYHSYRGPASVEIERHEIGTHASDERFTKALSGTFEARLTNDDDDALELEGSFSYDHQECR